VHDTGYIHTSNDTRGTGAKYTLNHIAPSIDFVNRYNTGDETFHQEMKNFANIIHYTGLNVKISGIHFTSDKMRLLRQMMGTADLLGQMLDR
jgi:hypothetical protein